MSAPVITVTLNPAVDQTVVLERLNLGGANRVLRSRTDPGGKGINVSRALREFGLDSIATGFAPGGFGGFIEHQLERSGISVDFIRTGGEMRTNLTLIDEKARSTTTIHAPGPATDERYVQQLRVALRKYQRAGCWLVVAGSIPPPIAPSLYGDLITEANAAGMQTALDAEGDALRAGLAAKPALVRMNLHDLAPFLDQELDSEAELLAAAERIHRDGAAMLLLTHRIQPNLAVNAEGVWRITPPTLPRSTLASDVGEGDAALAAAIQVLVAGGSFEEALRRAVAAASATLLAPGTQLCDAATVDTLESQVRVERIVAFAPA